MEAHFSGPALSHPTILSGRFGLNSENFAVSVSKFRYILCRAGRGLLTCSKLAAQNMVPDFPPEVRGYPSRQRIIVSGKGSQTAWLEALTKRASNEGVGGADCGAVSEPALLVRESEWGGFSSSLDTVRRRANTQTTVPSAVSVVSTELQDAR